MILLSGGGLFLARTNKEIQKNRVMIVFIEAAESILRKDGIDGLSIRKIADAAGYNSATIYNYFQDIDHLLLFASVKYIKEYIVALADFLNDDMTSMEKYFAIYEVFNQYAFSSPEIFYNLFFGKHSDKMPEVLSTYYLLFPDELAIHRGSVKKMLSEGNIFLRDKNVVCNLIDDGYIKEENADYVVQLIVRTHQSFLHEACLAQGELDVKAHSRKFMDIMHFIFDLLNK